MDTGNLPLPANPAPQSLTSLEHDLTTLAAHLNAGNYRFLELLAEFDRRGGHVGWGIASCAHWLQWKCGIGLVAAREKVRVARALPALPKIAGAMRRGVLSYCKGSRIGKSIEFGDRQDRVGVIYGHRGCGGDRSSEVALAESDHGRTSAPAVGGC